AGGSAARGRAPRPGRRHTRMAFRGREHRARPRRDRHPPAGISCRRRAARRTAAQLVAPGGSHVVSRGFTFVELLLCLVAAGLRSALSLPSGGGVVTRARRSEAAAALYALAAAQERYRLVHGRYAELAAPAPPVGLGLGRSGRGWYEL